MRGLWITIVLIGLLAGCAADPAPVEELPTAVSLDALATERAATADVLATERAATAAALATPTRPPLPPTWTPVPSPTPEIVADALEVTPPPAGFRSTGTIYYVYNDNSLVELSGDGSFSDLMPQPAPGPALNGLSASPDGALLAFIWPGDAGGREVFVVDRAGNPPRQLSRLGLPFADLPLWSPDGEAVAFVAGPGLGGPLALYVVFRDGTGRMLAPITEGEPVALAWNTASDTLFFTDRAVYAVNIYSAEVTPALSSPTGFGPDFALVHNPARPELYFLKATRNIDTGADASIFTILDTTAPGVAAERRGGALSAQHLHISRDGGSLLIADATGFALQNMVFNTALTLVRDTRLPPRPIFSPDGEQIAYLDADADGVPQIFVIGRQGGEATRITNHTEGSVGAMVWVEG